MSNSKICAVITGDIINSEGLGELAKTSYIPLLSTYFSTKGTRPKQWEIYRGDEFQIEVQPEEALWTAFHIKAILKSIKGLDARLSIGIGLKDYDAESILQSNGTAFLYSGRNFEALKQKKINLSLKSFHKKFDETINLMLQLALTFMDDWTPTSANMVNFLMTHPKLSQQEMANLLGMNQSAISQRQKRAHFELIFELNQYFKHEIQSIL